MRPKIDEDRPATQFLKGFGLGSEIVRHIQRGRGLAFERQPVQVLPDSRFQILGMAPQSAVDPERHNSHEKCPHQKAQSDHLARSLCPGLDRNPHLTLPISYFNLPGLQSARFSAAAWPPAVGGPSSTFAPVVRGAVSALLPTQCLCYKQNVRKWMQERFKRRKKTQGNDPARAQGTPAPLQPKYFEAEPAEGSSGTGEAGLESPESTAVAQPQKERAPERPSSADAPAQGGADGARRSRRRRRGRGRRGRSVPTSPAAQAEPAASPGPEHAAGPPAAITAPKGVVVLAIGLPGSGKSSWFKRHNITPLSSDLLRSILFDDPTEQRFQDLVFSNLRSMLRARLIAARPMNYVDATNLSPHERANWIKLAHDYKYEVQAVFFDVPVEVCLDRNRRRERSVPEDVMHRMAGKLRAPAFDEGFTKITVVKVKKKEGDAPAD
jgi:predicted kinase